MKTRSGKCELGTIVYGPQERQFKMHRNEWIVRDVQSDTSDTSSPFQCVKSNINIRRRLRCVCNWL